MQLDFWDYDAMSGDDKMFTLWVHTSFIRKPVITLTKVELDKAIKDKKNKHFPPNFTCELTFSGTHHICTSFALTDRRQTRSSGTIICIL
jgi:hypothetical protein